jgi:hypothetical protein
MQVRVLPPRHWVAIWDRAGLQNRPARFNPSAARKYDPESAPRGGETGPESQGDLRGRGSIPPLSSDHIGNPRRVPGPAHHDRGLRPPLVGLPQEGDRPHQLRAAASRRERRCRRHRSDRRGLKASSPRSALRSRRYPPTRARRCASRLHLLPIYYPTPKRSTHPPRAAEPLERLYADLRLSGREDLNLRPFGPEPNALPGCATPRGERTLCQN